MTIDALEGLHDYEAFVLVSGDGDFVKLVKYLKGKKVCMTMKPLYLLAAMGIL
ncbi:MAG: NYN domain-containing protein [Deltaproteobacteria bacterium]|nr:NYN domain-containing protein [Deltaproteobacteria bacterium]